MTGLSWVSCGVLDSWGPTGGSPLDETVAVAFSVYEIIYSRWEPNSLWTIETDLEASLVSLQYVRNCTASIAPLLE